jgi:hypothetical protein
MKFSRGKLYQTRGENKWPKQYLDLVGVLLPQLQATPKERGLEGNICLAYNLLASSYRKIRVSV